MTDTEKEALCARIDELCAEVERGKAENAKLRELIADIHALDDLRYIPSWSLDEYGVRMADIEQRMRELGVEVE